MDDFKSRKHSTKDKRESENEKETGEGEGETGAYFGLQDSCVVATLPQEFASKRATH